MNCRWGWVRRMSISENFSNTGVGHGDQQPYHLLLENRFQRRADRQNLASSQRKATASENLTSCIGAWARENRAGVSILTPGFFPQTNQPLRPSSPLVTTADRPASPAGRQVTLHFNTDRIGRSGGCVCSAIATPIDSTTILGGDWCEPPRQSAIDFPTSCGR